MVSKHILISMIVIVSLVHCISGREANNNEANSAKTKPYRSDKNVVSRLPSSSGDGAALKSSLTRARSANNANADKFGLRKPITKNTVPTKPVKVNKPPATRLEAGIASNEDKTGQESNLTRLNKSVVKPASLFLFDTVRSMFSTMSRIKQSVVGPTNVNDAPSKK